MNYLEGYNHIGVLAQNVQKSLVTNASHKILLLSKIAIKDVIWSEKHSKILL